MTILKTNEFIQRYFIDELGQMIDKFPYHSFMIMSIGIELLGKCLNESYPNFHEGKPLKDFNRAIDNLNAFENYKSINREFKLHENLRNGMLHAAVPKPKITLSSHNEQKHLYENNGTINLRCEDFFEDFKKACLEVISIQSKKMKQPIISVPSGDYISFQTSGTTSIAVQPTYVRDNKQINKN